MFATDVPVMVGARMALLLDTLINDSKIMRKTQGEKMFSSIQSVLSNHYYFHCFYR